MRTTQVGLRIKGPEELVKVYSDAHGFWEAVVGAHNEAAMVLRELEKLNPGEGDPAGLQREATASISIEHFVGDSDETFPDPFNLRVEITAPTAWEALGKAFCEFLDQAEDYAQQSPYNGGRKENYTLEGWRIKAGYEAAPKESHTGLFQVEKILGYKYTPKKNYKTPAMLEIEVLSVDGERCFIDRDVHELLFWQCGRLGGRHNNECLTRDGKLALFKPEQQYDAMYFLRDEYERIRASYPVKTLAGYRECRLDFDDYIKVGDLVEYLLIKHLYDHSKHIASSRSETGYDKDVEFKQYRTRFGGAHFDDMYCTTCDTYKKQGEHWVYYGACLPLKSEDCKGICGLEKRIKHNEEERAKREAGENTESG